jgi:hypothetical protein
LVSADFMAKVNELIKASLASGNVSASVSSSRAGDALQGKTAAEKSSVLSFF